VIYLTSTPETAPVDRGPRALWVHPDRAHRRPVVPWTVSAAEYFELPMADIRRADVVVVVGLSQIVTPGNRVRTGPRLTEPWDGPPRVSVDRALFLGEPWRAWWHWGCVRAPWDDVETSFRMENLCAQALDKRRPDPCTIEEFVRVGTGVVRADDTAARFGGLDVEVLPTDPTGYDEEKARAFEEETTPAGLTRRLGQWAQAREPRRSVPTTARLFLELGRGRPPKVVATDLPVDRWLVSRLRHLIDLTDGIADAFRVTT
jgi:hypothetical protein